MPVKVGALELPNRIVLSPMTRIRAGGFGSTPLNPWDVRTFYGGDDHGYTDYLTLAEQGWPPKAP
jgi:2,4-dienoyl-CoA reductase-like NADH-dependent reductase (Old Yellow Enzyme family)